LVYFQFQPFFEMTREPENFTQNGFYTKKSESDWLIKEGDHSIRKTEE
jgi:hypothetical protein